MPNIHVELGLGMTNEDQKRELIGRLTAEAVEVTHIPAQNFTVFISEYPFENMGVGGKSIKELRAAR